MNKDDIYRVAIFMIVKPPKDAWTTAHGYSVGDDIRLPFDHAVESFKNGKQVTMQLGQGDGCCFEADELELVEISYSRKWVAKPSEEELEEMLIAQGNIQRLRKLKLKKL